MASVDQTAVTLFVPLVFGTVAQLSSLARDLPPDADGLTGRPSLLHPGRSRLLPSFGRLNVVHATNVLLLANTFLLVSALDASLLRHVLALIVLAVWLQLPLIEVAEYGSIPAAGRYPLSLYFHVASTLALVWFTAGHLSESVVALEAELLELRLGPLLASPELRPFLLFLALLVGSSAGFLHLLARDEPPTTRDEPPSSADAPSPTGGGHPGRADPEPAERADPEPAERADERSPVRIENADDATGQD